MNTYVVKATLGFCQNQRVLYNKINCNTLTLGNIFCTCVNSKNKNNKLSNEVQRAVLKFAITIVQS